MSQERPYDNLIDFVVDSAKISMILATRLKTEGSEFITSQHHNLNSRNINGRDISLDYAMHKRSARDRHLTGDSAALLSTPGCSRGLCALPIALVALSPCLLRSSPLPRLTSEFTRGRGDGRREDGSETNCKRHRPSSRLYGVESVRRGRVGARQGGRPL